MDKGYIYIDINQLVKAEWNYKEEDDFMYQQLKNNVKKNNQLISIIVRELEDNLYEVVNGNHRLDVFQDLKLPKILCYNLGKIEDEKAYRIGIETNEFRFKNNIPSLTTIIQDLNIAFTDLADTLPYTDVELEQFIGDDVETEIVPDTLYNTNEGLILNNSDDVDINELIKDLGINSISEETYLYLEQLFNTLIREEFIGEYERDKLINIIYKKLAKKTNNYIDI